MTETNGILNSIKDLFGVGNASAETIGSTTAGGDHPGVDAVFSEGLPIAIGNENLITSAVATCPWLDLPEFEFHGSTTNLMPTWVQICTALKIISAMVLLAGYAQWAYIVSQIGQKG